MGSFSHQKISEMPGNNDPDVMYVWCDAVEPMAVTGGRMRR